MIYVSKTSEHFKEEAAALLALLKDGSNAGVNLSRVASTFALLYNRGYDEALIVRGQHDLYS